MAVPYFTVDDKIIALWYKIYVVHDYDDPHQAFADEGGISRQNAKYICYRLAYTIFHSEIMETYKHDYLESNSNQG